MNLKRKKTLTPAEAILNPFIKGDIRDYDKEERGHFSITLDTALRAIRKALKQQSKEEPK